MIKYIANMDCGSGHTCLMEPLTDTSRNRIMSEIRRCAEAEGQIPSMVKVAEVDANGDFVDSGMWASRWNGETWTSWEYRER